MAWPPSLDDSTFWDHSQAREVVTRWRFDGADGLRRLTGPQRIWAEDPEAFAARLTRAQLDHVAIEHFSATEHRVERGDAEIEDYPTPLLTLFVLLEGRIDVELADARFTVSAGESLILDSRQPVAAAMTADVRMLRCVVGVEHIPAALQRDSASVPGPIPRTPLIESFAAFIGTILTSTADAHRPQGDHLVAAVSEMQAAVLAEAQQVADYPMGAVGLRYRIEEMIESQHADPRLDPAGIARAVGISLRHAHAVFDQGEQTLARVLRARRAKAAAHRLRVGDGLRLTDLARDAGFGSVAALDRAFREHYGMSPAAYRRDGYASFD